MLRSFSHCRFRRHCIVFLAVASCAVTLRAQMTDEEKKTLFLKNQQSSLSSSTSASDGAKPSSGASKKKSSSGSESKKSRKKSSQQSESAKSKSKKHRSAHSGVTSPTSHAKPDEKQATTPPSHPSQTVTSAGIPTSLPLPHGATPSAPIMIEKSGVETEQGFEPAPTPPSSTGHGWSWLFGSHRSYNYLNASTRAAIDRASVRRGRWKYIVVHNSGTREGNARVFDIYHRRVRHMVNGLAYHFVIGDGHGSGNGEIEIGHRWTAQLNGGHVASDYLNDIALGICLVGDFNRDLPTQAQMGALDELVTYLRDRVGKTQGHKAIVHAHKEINPRPTDCPGDRFPYSWLHAKFGNAN